MTNNPDAAEKTKKGKKYIGDIYIYIGVNAIFVKIMVCVLPDKLTALNRPSYSSVQQKKVCLESGYN